MLFWKGPIEGEIVYEVEFTGHDSMGNLAGLINSSGRSNGVVAFVGCTLGNYQGAQADGLMGLYRLPIQNWEESPLKEDQQISSGVVRAPVSAGNAYTLVMTCDGKKAFKAVLKGASSGEVSGEVKSRPPLRGQVGLWVWEADLTIRRLSILGTLDDKYVERELKALRKSK